MTPATWRFAWLVIVSSLATTSAPAQTWCVPASAKPYGKYMPGITHVTLANIDRASLPFESPQSSYALATDTTTLTAGEVYSITVTHTRDSVVFPNARNNIRVWIDYDKNGVFADSELVGLANYVPFGSTVITFRVPRTVVPVAQTRMRVTAKMSDEAGHSIPTPCDDPPDRLGYHGEIEDYVVSIAPTVPPKRANADPAAEALAIELLTADRAYAAAAPKLNVVDALSAMFANDVSMPAPPGVFAKNRDDAIKILSGNPDNARSRLTWMPVRAGVSGDGRQGFTFGFMTLTRPDSTHVPMKYLAYWRKDGSRWKVVAYKRAGRPAGDVNTNLMSSSLPAHLMAMSTSAADQSRLEKELGDVERAFSAEAGKIGLGPAFKKNGAPDAMNMGSGQTPGFVFGPDAISKNVGGTDSTPSALTWAPDERIIVASSGDLGITMGYINAPDPQGGAARRLPYMTIWRRVSPDAPWQYVAE